MTKPIFLVQKCFFQKTSRDKLLQKTVLMYVHDELKSKVTWDLHLQITLLPIRISPYQLHLEAMFSRSLSSLISQHTGHFGFISHEIPPTLCMLGWLENAGQQRLRPKRLLQVSFYENSSSFLKQWDVFPSTVLPLHIPCPLFKDQTQILELPSPWDDVNTHTHTPLTARCTLSMLWGQAGPPEMLPLQTRLCTEIG